MIEEDYEPLGLEDEDLGDMMNYGDYPKLKMVGANERDPFHNWDSPSSLRDFGEPMPIKFHVYTATQLDTGRKWPRTNSQWGLGFLLMIIVTFTIFSHSPRSYFPRMGRPMCWDGPHYSFEPEDGGRDITAEQPAHHH